MPVVARVASSNPAAYDYLVDSIAEWPDQGTLSQWMRGAGFTRVAYRNLTAGIVALHRGRKPADPASAPRRRTTGASTAPRLRRLTPVSLDLTDRLRSDPGSSPRPPQQHPELVARARREALRLQRGAALRRRGRDGLESVEDGLLAEMPFADDLADVASRYLLEAGGKRVRPMLTLLTAQLGDGQQPSVITAAEAIEITHLASLYHDDVMDEAQMRRGVPSAQTVWGNSVAILTGDLLFARASKLDREPRRARDRPAGRHVRAALPRPAARDDRPARRRRPDRALHPGARRQDRVADRGGRPDGRGLLGRPGRVPQPVAGVRREDRRRLPAHRRRHRPVGRGRDDRQDAPAPTCAPASPRCRCSTCASRRRPMRTPPTCSAASSAMSTPPTTATTPSFAAAVAELREHDGHPRRPSTRRTAGRARPSPRSRRCPTGPVKKALTRFADTIVERSS